MNIVLRRWTVLAIGVSALALSSCDKILGIEHGHLIDTSRDLPSTPDGGAGDRRLTDAGLADVSRGGGGGSGPGGASDAGGARDAGGASDAGGAPTTGSPDATTGGGGTAVEDSGPIGCAPGATRKCSEDSDNPALGNCAAGNEVCAAGLWGPCSVTPKAADSCTPDDDANCNGKKNDGCPCVDGTQQSCGPAADIGECRRGTQTCVGSAWGACVGAVTAKPRDCTSGLDLDCDGAPDNKIDTVCKCAVGATQDCDAHPGKDDKGPCHAGKQTCVVALDKKTSAYGTCAGAVGPAPADACDVGNDANCNGIPNEGCSCVNGSTQPCGPSLAIGVCKPGVQTCAASAWGACVGAVFATGRDCSKATDGDCNGIADSADATCECAPLATRDCTTLRLGPCKPGTQSCSLSADKKSSSWTTCAGKAPAAKDGCDPGADDNCNGIANEGCACVNGATKACGNGNGVCVQGKQTCTASAWGACVGGIGPGARDCTKAGDNDCNGADDRAEPPCLTCALGGPAQSCATGSKGPCAAGTRTCVAAADRQSVLWGACTGRNAAPVDGCNPPDDATCDGNVGTGCCPAARVCGSACCDTATPANSVFCQSPNTCATCKGSSYTCNSCGAWDFESGLGSWTLLPGSTVSASATRVAAPAGGSGMAMAINYSDPGTAATSVSIRGAICSTAGTSTTGVARRTASVRVLLQTRSGSIPAGTFMYFDPYSSDFSNIIGGTALEVQAGQWVTLSFNFIDNAAGTQKDPAYVYITFGLNRTAWQGTLYIDEFTIK